MEDLPGLFGAAFDNVLPMVGRGILAGGPDAEALPRERDDFLAA